MQILHASIPADRPKHVAETIAEILQGEAMPFPPAGPDGWMAWAGDGSIELEIVPRGHVLHHDELEAAWRPVPDAERLSEVHLAIGVDLPAKEILTIAHKASWPARLCSRGNGLFDLVELWVEGAFLIELFDPEQAAHFQSIVTPASWKAMLAHIPHHAHEPA